MTVAPPDVPPDSPQGAPVSGPVSPSPSGPGFIRAGGGVSLNGRRVATVLAALGLAVLVVVTATVAVSDARANSRIDRLRAHGVPVTVTVTGCLGISSGVGMGIEYWRCGGTYTLASRTYEAIIGGQRALLDKGQRIQAVAVPGDAASLSIPQVLQKRRSYALAEVLGGVTAALALAGAALLVRSRRRSASAAAPT